MNDVTDATAHNQYTPNTQAVDGPLAPAPTEPAPPARRVRHGQVVLGLISLAAAAGLLLGQLTGWTVASWVWPAFGSVVGAMLIVYGLVVLARSRSRSAEGDAHAAERRDRRREEKALRRITAREKRRSRG